MGWIMDFIGQILSVVEILLIVDFLIRFLGWKHDVSYRKVCTGVFIFLMYLAAQFNGRFENSHVVVLFAYFLLLFIFSTLFLQQKKGIQFLVCIFPLLMVSEIDILVMQISASIRKIAVNLFLDNKNGYLVFTALLTKVILWYILRKIRLLYSQSIIRLTRKFYLIADSLIILNMSIEVLLFYVINSGVYDSTINAMLIVVTLGIILLSIYIGYSIFKISEQDSQIFKYELTQLQTQEKERQIEEFKRSYSRIRQFTHDYKNHCMSMQKLLEDANYEELDKYLRSITGRYLEMNCDFVNTNNPLIDSILNTKIYQCKENGIDIVCTVAGDISHWDKVEIGIILFNLLDNAIEASMKEEKQGKIEFILKREGGVSNITIKNTVSRPVLKNNTELKTDKLDKEIHGIGHTTVAELTEELNGMVEYYEKESKFCAHVFLPL